MKSAWRNDIQDLAAWNSAFVEEVDQLDEFQGLLDCDVWQSELDKLELEDPFGDDSEIYLVDLRVRATALRGMYESLIEFFFGI